MGPTSGPVTHCDTTDPRRTLLVPTALVTYMGTMVPTSCKLCTFDIKVTYYFGKFAYQLQAACLLAGAS